MTHRLLKLHRPAAVLIAIATIAAGSLLAGRGLTRDYSLAAFVADDSAAYADFRRLMDEFVSNEFAVIALKADDVESADNVAFIERIVSRLRSLPQVQRVTSLADVPAFVRTALGERLRSHPLFQNTLISRDGKTTAVLLQMLDDAHGLESAKPARPPSVDSAGPERGQATGSQSAASTGETRKRTVSRLKQIVADARRERPDLHIILAGPYVTLIDMYDYVDHDLRVFSTAALALLVVTLALVFRRPAPAVFAMATSLAAVVCTLGITSAMNLSTALITQMLVILILVLSVANCVHLAVAEDEEFAHAPFYDWAERSRRVLDRMTAPCTAVVLTTAVGFGSVCVSSITPVRTFGLLMVIGLFLSLVFSLTTLTWLARARRPAAVSPASDALSHWLKALGVWTSAHRSRVIALFALAALFCAAALPRLRFESDFVKNFRPDSEVRRSYDFLESNLAPTGSVEIVVRRRDGAPILSPHAVAAARTLGRRAVETFDPVRKALSIADILTLSPGPTPTTDFEINARLAVARRLLGEPAVRNFLNAAETALRINLRVAEGLSVHRKLDLSDSLTRLAGDVFGEGYTIETTGLYHFYAVLVSQLWRDQFRSLGLTVVAVYVILMIVLRSVKVALIAMVPTALPVLFCVGAMGWTGIPVNMTTALMLSVTLGIAVDDAVHYLWRFRAALRESGDYSLALKTAHGSVGRACVFTTVVIATGFWILTLSRFLPTAYFGGLLGFTLCGALAADLLLLPALVMVFRPFPLPARSAPAPRAPRPSPAHPPSH